MEIDYYIKYIKYKNKYMGAKNNHNFIGGGKNKILLTGSPGSGKSTALEKIVQQLSNKDIKGFITKEIKEDDQRVGFRLERLDNGMCGIIASTKINSDKKFGKWNILIDNVNKLIEQLNITDNDLLIFDEIAPMQLVSETFRELTTKWLDSDNIMIGIIKEDHQSLIDSNDEEKRMIGEFIKSVKERDNVELIEITKDNRENMVNEIVKKIKNL